MIMSPSLRKFALTAHVLASVGWLGAVASLLALAIAGLANQDAQIARAAYVAMEVLTWTVIVPLAFASLLSGLVQALGTPWGLFRHYWVLFKLTLTLLATILLLVHTQPIHHVADAAVSTLLAVTDLRQTRIQLLVDAAAALLVLLVTTTLSVYKPRGLTPYGWRKLRERPGEPQPELP